MKKMKGLVPTPAATRYEDPRAIFKHQTLMQDYEDLYKETEAKKKQLLMMRQKKLNLAAEVRFLRRRFKYLTRNSHKTPMERNSMQPQNSMAGKNSRKERNLFGSDATLRYPALRFDMNQRGRIYNERELMSHGVSPIFDLNQKQKTYIGKEAALQNSVATPDLNRERNCSGKESRVQNPTPIFDLNQISREEEEIQADGDAMRMEEPKINSTRGGNDDQHNDMKLLACRSVGNGSSRAGKRKITWQDQVALRV